MGIRGGRAAAFSPDEERWRRTAGHAHRSQEDVGAMAVNYSWQGEEVVVVVRGVKLTSGSSIPGRGWPASSILVDDSLA